jgi:hypothetical protein
MTGPARIAADRHLGVDASPQADGVVRRLVLSRKGWDSGFGGRPSPVLADGTMISLPIPYEDSDLTYSQCRAPNGQTYLEVLTRLGIDHVRRPVGGGRTTRIAVAEAAVHLDPDLYADARPRPEGWRPLFGQIGPSQVHLANQAVGPGDVFLFFGWFSPVDDLNGGLRYRPKADRVQALFGWLEIADVIAIDDAPTPPWAREHPHVVGRDRPTFRDRHNTLYLAAERSSFVPGLPGGGVFTWSAALTLTQPGATPSVWRLPLTFHPDNTPAPLTHHGLEAWERDGEHVILKSARIGQEFVVPMTKGIEAWVTDVIGHGCGVPVAS